MPDIQTSAPRLPPLRVRTQSCTECLKSNIDSKVIFERNCSHYWFQTMTESDISKIFRRKTRKELILLSSIVCGIEFCYSAETAFVTPTLLTAGIPIDNTTVIWSLSPLIGFFVSPVLGSLSDACASPLGRRRPFILVYSIGIILGLILVPNSQYISKLFAEDFHSLSIFFTIFGAVLLDFCCDACQSPSRALLCEVTLREDHALGLSTFTSMAGFGGAVGYLIGSIDWEEMEIVTNAFGSDHKKIVFLLCAIAFVICAVLTITSFQEIPLYMIKYEEECSNDCKYQRMDETEESYEMIGLRNDVPPNRPKVRHQDSLVLTATSTATFFDYLYSIIRMPTRLRILCLTNLFSWMSLICYSLYFTDFVAESVFTGDPTATVGSDSFRLYESGVKFGCICMTFYSISCSVYSYYFQNLVNYLGAKALYVGSGVIYSIGMLVIGITRSRTTALVLSFSAGIQYSTLFTMPYALVAKYQMNDSLCITGGPRGLGTDIAVVGSMVFLAQFLLSLCVGTIIDFFDSHSVTVFMASILSAGSACFAAKVDYIEK